MVETPDESRKSALFRIIEVVSNKSAKILAYSVAALGILALIPNVQLPPEFTLLAGGLGINLVANLIDRVAFDKSISEDEIIKQVDRLLDESLGDKLFSKEDFYHAFSLLRKGQRTIIDQNQDLAQLVDSIAKTIETKSETSKSNLLSEIIDYSTLIRDRTDGFVGRRFIFNELNTFVEQNHSGYFIIQGEPGIGKTAIVAELVKQHGYFHHFLIGTQGIVRLDQFIRNISAQLAVHYELGNLFSPKSSIDNGEYLLNLLEKVSKVKNDENDKTIILLDGLDEAEFTFTRGANIFYLPTILPRGIFFLLTFRPKDEDQIPLYISCPSQTIFLEPDSRNNLIDIVEYLSAYSSRSGIQQILKSKNIPDSEFIKIMIEHSEGNFMYLHYVLPEIEKGQYKDLSFSELPKGLMGYYENHWLKIREGDDELWSSYREPIIVYLAVAREPLSTAVLSKITNIPEHQVRTSLKKWSEFLQRDRVEGISTYRIYHNSFKEFLKMKSELGEINLLRAEEKLADMLLGEWNNIKQSYGKK